MSDARRAVLALAALAATALAAAQIAIPPLKARVTDLTGTLSSEQRLALEHTLAEFESRKGAQVAVLLVPSTQPEAIEQYAVRVEEAWKLGRKGVDDGVLLLVAKDDRRLWIEVGYGLEGVLPDAVAKRIIDGDITPRFKDGDFYGGIRAGTDRIMRVIEGEALPPPRPRDAAPPVLFQYLEWVIPALIILFIAENLFSLLFGRLVGSGLAAAAIGLVTWVAVGSLVIASIVAAVALLIGLFGPAAMFSRARGRGRAASGGWSGADWSSSGSSGGGSSGGGFSGGGGSSGGGGAGGSW